jgi:hypothetical protein
MLALTLNYFRRELFGLYLAMPHNFAFNIIFFIPVTLFVFLLVVYVVNITIANWSKWIDLKKKITILCLTVLILIVYIASIIRIVALLQN